MSPTTTTGTCNRVRSSVRSSRLAQPSRPSRPPPRRPSPRPALHSLKRTEQTERTEHLPSSRLRLVCSTIWPAWLRSSSARSGIASEGPCPKARRVPSRPSRARGSRTRLASRGSSGGESRLPKAIKVTMRTRTRSSSTGRGRRARARRRLSTATASTRTRWTSTCSGREAQRGAGPPALDQGRRPTQSTFRNGLSLYLRTPTRVRQAS